jgi:butyrate kinase
MAITSLVINPGSTSTKIAVFEDEMMSFEETIRHEAMEIHRFAAIADQLDFRYQLIIDILKKNGIELSSLDVIVGRGGLLKPISGGTYAVTKALLEDLKIGVQGQHASNLGGILAHQIALSLGKPAYVVDPVVVDELMAAARISGVPELPRTSIFHALNQKAVARRYAAEVGKVYEDLNLIVVHLGGGVSVGAHQHGRVIDVFNALDGDGAFSPERSGGVPAGALVKMCFSGAYTEKEVYQKLVGKGGIQAYLGTNSMIDVLEQSDHGDTVAKDVLAAFLLQIAKDVGAMACVLKGKVDAIVITGGIAHSVRICEAITASCDWIAPLKVYPGEDEMLALAQGAIRVMRGEEQVKEY